MDPGLGQLTHGLVVGGLGLPVVSGLVGLVVNVLTARAIPLIAATRVVFLILGVTVVAGMTSGRIPAAEGAACLVGQVVAWGLLLGPRPKRRRR